MAWTDGVDQVTGFLVTAGLWNAHHGASGNDMELKFHTHDGTAGDGDDQLHPKTRHRLWVAGILAIALAVVPEFLLRKVV